MLLLAASGANPAYAKKKKPKRLAPPPADLPGHVNYLAKQLFGVPLDESGSITSDIQKLVLDDVEQWLNAHPDTDASPAGVSASSGPAGARDIPYDVQVRRELERAFSGLHYPLLGRPAVFVRPWKTGELIGAGYTLGWTDEDRVNVLALFEASGGKTRLAAVTPFVPQVDLRYAFPAFPASLGSPALVHVIAYGTRLGRSHPRLTAVLYAFDGQSLKSLWETRDVYDGELELNGDRVTIRYMKEDEFIRETREHRTPPHYEAIYKVTPGGLELESDREVQ